MSDLATLRGLSGLATEPPSLKDSALVMIDLQETYRQGVMRLDGVEPALREAAALLARARDAGIPIIHVRHDAGPGSPYDITAPIGQISEAVAPGAMSRSSPRHTRMRSSGPISRLSWRPRGCRTSSWPAS